MPICICDSQNHLHACYLHYWMFKVKIIFILNFDNLIDKKKKQTMFWVVCLVLFACGGCSASTTTQPNVTQTNIPQSDRVYNDLMKDFNKYVRPTEVSLLLQ